MRRPPVIRFTPSGSNSGMGPASCPRRHHRPEGSPVHRACTVDGRLDRSSCSCPTPTGRVMAPASLTPPNLIGRSTELAVLDRHLDTARMRGAALILTGAAGVGKSALLDAAAPRAAEAGFQVLRVTGCPFQKGVSFSALNQLLQPLAVRLGPDLPGLRRETAPRQGGRRGPCPSGGGAQHVRAAGGRPVECARGQRATGERDPRQACRVHRVHRPGPVLAADPAGAAGGPPGRHRTDEQADRRAALPVTAHGGRPSPQCLPEVERHRTGRPARRADRSRAVMPSAQCSSGPSSGPSSGVRCQIQLGRS
jgi:hypothetical protein